MKQEENETIDRKIDRKLYLILVITGCVANTIWFTANCIIYGMTLGTIVCAACAVLLLLIGIIGYNFKYRKQAEFIILFLIGFFEFPFLYYVYGKSTFVYMILGIVAVSLFLKGMKRQLMLVLQIIFDTGTILAAYFYPCNLENITEENSIGSTVCSYLIVSVSVGALLTLIVNQYIKQQKELVGLTQELDTMTKLDPLTGAYNRRYLTDYISGLLTNPQACFSIALLDIDNFKRVNDEYGHLYGDEILQAFVAILKKEMEGRGIVARFGGEEFMLVFQTADREQIARTMERSASELRVFSMETKNMEITFSGGVEEVHNEKRITLMFNSADEKLYQAKRTGKNRVVFE